MTDPFRLNPQDFVEDAAVLLRGEKLPFSGLHVLIAAWPKTESSALTNRLQKVLGISGANLCGTFHGREQEIDNLMALIAHRAHYVVQLHLRYSPATRGAIFAYSLQPIVLVRNIFDIVISMRDHLRSCRFETSPMICFSPAASAAWMQRSDAEVEDLVIELILPWYVNFYASWLDSPFANRIVTYEELMIDADPQSSMKRILSMLGLSVSDERLAEGLAEAEQGFNRLNVGKQGRGQSLSDAQKDRIRRLFTLTGQFDAAALARIGLTA